MLAAPASGQGVEDRDARFAEATARFEAGDFVAAREGYEALLADGAASEEIHLNLGSVYFRLDDLGRAVLHYERARLLAPGSREAEHNLAIARTRLPDPIAEAPMPAPRQWVRWLGRNMPVGMAFWLGVLAYVGALALLGVRLWRGSRSDWLRRALVACALLGGALLGLAFSASVAREADRAVVVLNETPLRASLADDAEAVRTVGEGVVARLLAPPTGRRLHVRLPDGTTGYVSAEDAAPI